MCISKEILKQLPTDKWQTGLLRGKPAIQVQWFPLVSLVEERFHEGITKDGEWVHETSADLVPLRGDALALMLRILRRPFGEVERTLVHCVEDVSVANELFQGFPLTDIVFEGLKRGDYWAELALERISEDAALLKFDEEALSNLLAMIVSDKKSYSQRVRHMSQRLMLQR